MKQWKIVLLINIVWLVQNSEIQRQQIYQQKQKYLQQDQYWFQQILDHFNYLQTDTWQQRYYVYPDFFNPTLGPIILYICGEAECRGITDTSYTAKIAQQTHGLVLSLQHRYYGKSLPFGTQSLSFPNLKYLTSEQALRDLAYFITKMKNSGKFRIQPKNPWITIGGSYAGAMASWFRSKYPHLTVGSIGSSGVILAVENFKMFDQQIYISSMKSGRYCQSAITTITQYVQQQLIGNKSQQFKAKFNATELSTQEFLFYWSDVIVFQIQYGNRVGFCNSMKDISPQQQYAAIQKLVLKITPVDYGAYYLRNQTFAIQDGRGGRAWIYQSCTQFSYFQTYSQLHPMRSKRLTLDFYRLWCSQIFGPGIWPYTKRVNTQFGGLDIDADHLIMTNGDQDPWQWASLQKSHKPSIYTHIITCDDCAHCVDLHAPNKNDAKDLNNTRTHQLESVKNWINQHYRINGEL